MQTVGLIRKKGFVHFRTWNVETGPTEWDDRNVWEEIDDYLAKNDVRAASSLLRFYLEYFSKEACHNLKAPVVFRGDAQFTLVDLMPPGVSYFRKLLRKGKSAAESWGQDSKKAEIEALEEAIRKACNQTDLDQWQVNGAVHYNEKWASLDKNDFKPVSEGYKNLVDLFRCKACKGLLRVVLERGEKQNLRCDCGEININLLPKSN